MLVFRQLIREEETFMLRISKNRDMFYHMPISFHKSNTLHISFGDKFRVVLLIAWRKIWNEMNNELWQMMFSFTVQQCLYLRFMAEVRINYWTVWHQSLCPLWCKIHTGGIPQSLSWQPIPWNRNDVYGVILFTYRNSEISVKSHCVSLLCCLYMTGKRAGLRQCLCFRAGKKLFDLFSVLNWFFPLPFLRYLLKMHILPRMIPRVFLSTAE